MQEPRGLAKKIKITSVVAVTCDRLSANQLALNIAQIVKKKYFCKYFGEKQELQWESDSSQDAVDLGQDLDDRCVVSLKFSLDYII